VKSEITTLNEAGTTPNDPYFDYQWGLDNTGQTNPYSGGGTAGADIDAPDAWDIETGSSDVIIAIIDCGIDYNHPDLADNM
jgi:subtilisin family serine protease